MKTVLPYWKRQFISAAKRFFRAMGYEIVANSYNQATMDGGLLRAGNLGIKINTVIDIGASNGRWSELCMKYYPDAKYLLIEAQKEYKPYLESLCKKHNNILYSLSVASDKSGKIYFDDTSVGGGTASSQKINENYKEFDAITLDTEIENRGLKPPFLIKFDTHGFEIPIMEGAQNILKDTHLIVIEAYNFKLNDITLRFHEMITKLETMDFRCIDIVNIPIKQRS